MTEICRTCLQEVGDSSNVFYLDALESQSETITIRCKLADCVPEMDLDVVPNAFICHGCFDSLTIAHEFKNKCLETEGRIQSYIEQMGYVLTSVDLREIVQQSKPVVSTDVKPPAPFTQDSSQDSNKIEPASTSLQEKVHEQPKAESLDLKNLQCDTRAFFAVPKIAQLLAEGDPHKCTRCTYKASSDFELRAHEDSHLNQRLQGFFAAPKIAQLLAKDNGSLYRCSQCTYVACSDLDLKSHEEVHFNHKPQGAQGLQDLFSAPKIAQLLAEGDFSQKAQKCDFFGVPKIADPHNCSQCTYVASSELDLQSHEETHFNQKLHKCTECDYSAPKRQTLIVHMRKHSGTKPYYCKECGYNTPYRNILHQHVRAHTDEKPFKCDFCNYRGRLKFDLKIHMRVHSSDNPYPCPLCDYSSSHKTNLRYHMRTHAESTSYKCKICDYKSLQKANLQNHLKTTHRKSLGDKQPYACTFCDYSSSAKVNLIKHVMSHAGEKPFQCFDCGYRTIAKVDLERHMRVHFNENSSACSVCLKAFGDLENLRQHMRNHSGKLAVGAATHLGSDLSESTSDTSSATPDFQINRDSSNCESAVKKEMII